MNLLQNRNHNDSFYASALLTLVEYSLEILFSVKNLDLEKHNFYFKELNIQYQ